MLIRTLAISLLLTAAALAAPTVSQLSKAPTEVTIGQASVKVDKAFVWRDAQNFESKNLIVRVELENLPQGARITGVYLLNKDQLWGVPHPEVHFSDKSQMATARGGPAWDGDSKVDVVVEVTRSGQVYRLRLPAQPISRVD